MLIWMMLLLFQNKALPRNSVPCQPNTSRGPDLSGGFTQESQLCILSILNGFGKNLWVDRIRAVRPEMANPSSENITERLEGIEIEFSYLPSSPFPDGKDDPSRKHCTSFIKLANRTSSSSCHAFWKMFKRKAILQKRS